jgi:tRNA wybutosine-synthesizing protein 4
LQQCCALRVTMSKVQETADDAAISKCSAVRAGYYADPFIAQFLRKPLRRSPLINRGYFARIASVDLIVHRFLGICRAMDTKCQVVSLGAGAAPPARAAAA